MESLHGITKEIIFEIGRYAYFDKEKRTLCFGTGYKPTPAKGEVLLRVLTCGICRTGILDSIF